METDAKKKAALYIVLKGVMELALDVNDSKLLRAALMCHVPMVKTKLHAIYEAAYDEVAERLEAPQSDDPFAVRLAAAGLEISERRRTRALLLLRMLGELSPTLEEDTLHMTFYKLMDGESEQLAVYIGA